MSFAQSRLWLLHRLEGANPAYHISLALHFAGSLEIGALAGCLHALVDRHESLRTRFAEDRGEPCQIVGSSAELPVLVTDLSALPFPDRAGEAERCAAADADCPFDLSAAPLLRARLLALGEGTHTLVLTIHHLVADGWSIEILLDELVRLYRGLPLADLPRQYLDYARWERERLSGARLERLLGHWRGELAGAPATLDLPTDRPRAARADARGAALWRDLEPALAERLEARSREEGVTLFVAALAAFAGLLSRYSHQEDLVLGTGAANRGRRELEPIVGFFANTLALRLDLSGDPAVRELLQRARRTTFQALGHQELPFDLLVQALRPERAAGQNPLFETMFALESPLPEEIVLPGLRIRPVDRAIDAAAFDLSLLLWRTPRGLRALFLYRTALFDRATILRLAEHFETLLAGIADDLEARLSALPLLAEAERHQILREWSPGPGSAPATSVIAEFHRQVERSPDAVALVCGELRWSYRDLSRRAEGIAARLRTLGVREEDRVGLLAGRSIEAIAGILGIVKAGAAYVPIDPYSPAERTAFLLDDAEIRAVLVQRARVERLPEGSRFETVILEEISESSSVQFSSCGSSSLLYLLYTSGSTGAPKGVAVTQSGVLRLALGENRFRSSGHDVFLQLSPLTFDASTLEIWGPLLTGGRMVIFSQDTEEPSLDAVASTIEKEGVTFLVLVPSLFHALAGLGADRLGPVRQVLVGGEVVSAAQTRLFLDRHPRCRVFDSYGPTEDTVYSTCHPLASPDEVREPLPIGRAIAGSRAYVLDRNRRMVPAGVAGELHTGGAGLARGYWNDPVLTARKFVPDPFGERPGERLFATGDLARLLPDGSIEFLGRIDHQVKIRGYRIEPGEIENALGRHPGVRQAVAVAREDQPGQKSLVAYFVPGAAEPGDDGLRRFLAERLPFYMIPAAFVSLPRLPLTPRGKIDRAALPAPGTASPLAEPRRTRTPLEEIVCLAFAEVLRIAEVSPGDHFFERGGHSLAGVQLVHRLGRSTGVSLPLEALFEHPRAAQLAREIARRQRGSEVAPMERITRSSRDVPPSASIAQEQVWHLQQALPEAPLFNSTCPLRLSGTVDPAILERSFAAIVARHEILRTGFFLDPEGQVRQRIESAAPFELPAFDLGEVAPSERRAAVEALAREEARLPFDLAEPPLFRATLLRLTEDEAVLLLTIHHIISDGWSIELLLRELAAIYDVLHAGGAIPPPAPLQFADFAVWERRMLADGAFEPQLEYWRRQLAGPPPVLDLPGALPADGPELSLRTERRSITVSQQARDAFFALGAEHGATAFMALLAALVFLLHRETGSRRIRIGTVYAGRDQEELESLVGLFMNTLLLTTEVEGADSFLDLLDEARSVTLAAYAHGRPPFDAVAGSLEGTDRLALCQVMLLFQRAWLEPPASCHFGITRLAAEGGFEDPRMTAATFDLTMMVDEVEEGLIVALLYKPERFEAGSVERLLERYGAILRGPLR